MEVPPGEKPTALYDRTLQDEELWGDFWTHPAWAVALVVVVATCTLLLLATLRACMLKGGVVSPGQVMHAIVSTAIEDAN